MNWAGKARAKLVSGVGLIIGGTAFAISQVTKPKSAPEAKFEIVAATVVTFPVIAPLMLAAVVCDSLDR